MFTKMEVNFQEASGSEYPHAALDGAVFVGSEKSLSPPGRRDVQGTGLTGKAKVMDRFAQGKRSFNKVYLS